MPRYANPYPNGPYPTDPMFGSIGQSIARALFGDPQARAEQEQQQAEMERVRAATGYDLARTKGVDIQNDASTGLSGIFAQLLGPQAAQQMQAPPVADMATLAEMATGAAPMPTAPVVAAPTAEEPFGGINVDGVPPVNYDERIRSIVPALLSNLSQMQGDKVDPRQVFGTLAAILGSDGMARRGMVAQGQTPGKEFALDMDRADEIAQQGYDADYKTKTGVATINNESDIPVANIRAGATVDAARVAGESRVQVAGVNNVGKTDVAMIKEGYAPKGQRNNNLGNLRDGPFARSQPGYVGNDGTGFAVFSTPADGNAAQERLLRNSYIGKGFNTPAKIVAKYAPSNENSSASMNNYAAYIARKAGVDVNGVIPADKVGLVAQAMREFENGTQTSGKPAKAGKASKPVKVTGPEQKSLQEGIGKIFNRVGLNNASPKNKNRALARLTKFYQETGNMAEALLRSETELKASLDRVNARAKGGGWGPIQVEK